MIGGERKGEGWKEEEMEMSSSILIGNEYIHPTQ